MFDAEWRDMTQDLRRNVGEVAGAIEASNEIERMIQ
jgi:hypothetical protein